MDKYKKLLGRLIPVGAGLALISGSASAAGVLGNVDFSGIGSEVGTAAAAIAAVYVIIAGARIALGFIKRA